MKSQDISSTLASSVALILLAAATRGVAHAQEAVPVTTAPVTRAPRAPVRVLKAYDVKALALLQRAANRTRAAKSYSADVEDVFDIPATAKTPARKTRTVITSRLQKPNLVYSDYSSQKQGPDGKWAVTSTIKSVSDGKKGRQFRSTDKFYIELDVTKDALEGQYFVDPPIFFGVGQSGAQRVRDEKASGLLVSLTMARDAMWGGVPCSVVERKTLVSKDPKYASVIHTLRTYIGKKDGLNHGYHDVSPSIGEDGTITTKTVVSTRTNVVIDRKIAASTFSLTVPGYVEPLPLAAGTVAPDFTVYDKEGKPVKLSDFRGKVVLLDFWATWCVPCIESFPHTAEVAKKNADKGVVVLAVNVWDTQDKFDKWLPKHPEFSALTFAIDTTPGAGQGVARKLYNVQGIPTQYVIDRTGKVVTSFVEGRGDDLEKAITKAITKADAGTTGAQR